MLPRDRRWLTTVPVLVWAFSDVIERYIAKRKERKH